MSTAHNNLRMASPAIMEDWVMIGLHDDDVVYEQTTEPPTDDGSALMRQLREASPEEHELRLTTDQERVKSA